MLREGDGIASPAALERAGIPESNHMEDGTAMERTTTPSTKLLSLRWPVPCIAAALSSALLCTADAQTTLERAPAEPVTRKAAAAPLTWKAIDLRDFYSPGAEWTVYLESAETGVAVTASRTSPIRQTRLRICLKDEAGNERDIAYVQHRDNLTIDILEPDDPALTAAPVVRNDDADPWPNPCGFNFVETKHTIDIDEDDHLDLAVKFYSTVSDPEARGLLLLDEGPDGFPTRVVLDEVLDVLDPSRIALQDIVYPDDSNKPLLEARYRPLEKCGFLVELDIPGEAECESCCDMRIYLREIVYRQWVPTYYRPLQHGLLDRVRKDVAMVSSSDPAGPLLSMEKASLARMASFFYLTGQGERTREQLETALGPRKDDIEAQVLMDKLERYFLTPAELERQRNRAQN